MIKNPLIILTLLFGSMVFAATDEPPAPVSHRSNPDAHFWVSGSVGPEIALAWGLTGGGGIGFHGGASARVQFGRCGGIVDYHNDSSMYFFDPAGVHTLVIGAGVSCDVLTMGKGKFLKNSKVVARALVDYGQMDYSISGVEHLSGNAFGMGGTIGADFYVPIYFGFWAHAGPSLDIIDYKYKIPSGTGVQFNHNMSESLLGRVGIDYAF